jgi:hypothetical protein
MSDALLGAIAILLCAGASARVNADSATAGPAGTPDSPQAHQPWSGLSVPFESNAGQFDARVAFAARTFAGTLFVTRDGTLVHSFAGKSVPSGDNAIGAPRGKPATTRGRGWTLTETLVDAKPRPSSGVPSETRVSRFVGNDPARWQSDVATFRTVSLGEAWPGIAVELAARGDNVEKLFTVAPGADAKRIAVRVRGATSLRVDATGALVVQTGSGPVSFTSPVAWQEIDGSRRPIDVAYALAGDRYGFRLGVHDPGHAVVIDPLLQTTYLGGGSNETIYALAVDASGDVFVAGATYSSDFPGTTGGAQSAPRGGRDAFVARLDNGLRTMIRATYLGGAGNDDALALKVDAAGNVFVAGTTDSTDLAGIAGGAQATPGGGTDAFVARFDNALTSLVQATYLGGAGADSGAALALDAAGRVFVAGTTSSTNFPGTSGGAQPVHGGGAIVADGFAARLEGSLAVLTQATYLGGNDGDSANAIALDASGEVFVAGDTYSRNFPGAAGGAQPVIGDGLFPHDAFIAKLNAGLTILRQATYLGGSDNDIARGIAIDARGDVFTAGTWAHWVHFPRPIPQGVLFVAKHGNGLTVRLGFQAFSGSTVDEIGGITVDGAGNVFVAGTTGVSPMSPLPPIANHLPGTQGGAQEVFGGVIDAFVARFDNALAALVQSTYVGGTQGDGAVAIAFDPAGDVVIAGRTDSVDLPARLLGYQATKSGADDGFVTRLTATLRSDDGPAAPAPIDVPSLAPWLLVALAGLVAAVGARHVADRRR